MVSVALVLGFFYICDTVFIFILTNSVLFLSLQGGGRAGRVKRKRAKNASKAENGEGDEDDE